MSGGLLHWRGIPQPLFVMPLMLLMLLLLRVPMGIWHWPSHLIIATGMLAWNVVITVCGKGGPPWRDRYPLGNCFFTDRGLICHWRRLGVH
jgi:hypothetical protein